MKVSSSFLTITSAVLGVTLITTSVEAFPAYRPQPRGIPSVRVSGGTRSPLSNSCISNPQAPQLTALFPEDDLGYTTDYYPAFQWYMPANNADYVEFNLYKVVSEGEGDFQPVYQTAFVPSPTAGIATLQLPELVGIEPLAADTYYYWSVDVYCPDDVSAVMSTEGYVELLVPDSSLALALAESDGVTRAAIAAENSVWFDATRALTTQLQAQPSDPQTRASWQILLESIGLENIADAPLLP